MIDLFIIALLQTGLAQQAESPSPAVELSQADVEEQRRQARRAERRQRRCRMETLTGSRIPERACSSQDQEDAWSREARWMIQRITPNPKDDRQ